LVSHAVALPTECSSKVLPAYDDAPSLHKVEFYMPQKKQRNAVVSLSAVDTLEKERQIWPPSFHSLGPPAEKLLSPNLFPSASAASSDY